MSTVTTKTPWTAVDRSDRSFGRYPGVPGATLSARESEVLALIARGYSNKEIADELFLSINSIKSHIRSAYRRIGVERRTQAVLWAIEHAPLVAVDSESQSAS